MPFTFEGSESTEQVEAIESFFKPPISMSQGTTLMSTRTPYTPRGSSPVSRTTRNTPFVKAEDLTDSQADVLKDGTPLSTPNITATHEALKVQLSQRHDEERRQLTAPETSKTGQNSLRLPKSPASPFIRSPLYSAANE